MPVGISREEFDQQRRPHCGTANPERMQMSFWEWMIRGDETAIPDDGSGQPDDRRRPRALNPWDARKLFNIAKVCEDGPIWTFERIGATRPELPDGRIIAIGGEHEDHYDPDFQIFNDVVIVHPDGRIKVYGYPREVFPPTDLHTATLVGNQILVIGAQSYPGDRRIGQTPVETLDLADFRIATVETSGVSRG